MDKIILLAAALQRWDLYSTHALAAREVAAALAKDTTQPLHVLSVYEYDFKSPTSGLPAEMLAKLHEDTLERTNSLMERKIDDYVEPLQATGLAVEKMLRVGNPRNVIVQTATDLGADLLVIGSHSKRSLFDVVLGDTAKYLSQHAPCPVVLVSPKK